MIVSCLLLILSLFSPPLFGWDGKDHQQITHLALEEVAREWGLDRPVPIRSLQSFLDKLSKIRPKLGNQQHWADYLKVNPKTDLEFLPSDLKAAQSLTPLVILSRASVDPDDGRDQDLPHLSPDQKWFGVLRGPDSQAFRHIEKPPFDLRHPIRTFGLPFRALGEATKRAEIYFQASLLAFSLGEDYWGWRLLAGSLHYIEDLHNPYHAGQITPGLLVRGLWAYLRWGHREKGLMGTLSHLVSNSHRFFESYVASPRENDLGMKREILKVLTGTDYPVLGGTVRDLAIRVRDESNRDFSGLVCAVTEVTLPLLRDSYKFKSEGTGLDDPARFLKEGPRFEEANRKIFEITRERFQSAGRVIRTVIKKSLTSQGAKPPEEILRDLDSLLYPTSS